MPTYVSYAGFWKRVAAALIDGIICAIAGAIVGAILGAIGATRVAPLCGVLIGWLYSALLESSPNQATCGKMALGIVVTDLNGERISFGRATGRHFGKILSGLTLGIGYLMVAFTGSLTHLAWLRAGRTRIAAVFCPTRLASAPSPWARSGIRRPRVASWCRRPWGRAA